MTDAAVTQDQCAERRETSREDRQSLRRWVKEIDTRVDGHEVRVTRLEVRVAVYVAIGAFAGTVAGSVISGVATFLLLKGLK